MTLMLVGWIECRSPRLQLKDRARRTPRLRVFDNGFELDIWAVFKNNCLRGNIYILLSSLFLGRRGPLRVPSVSLIPTNANSLQDHKGIRAKRHFLTSKKSGTSCPNWGEGRGER